MWLGLWGCGLRGWVIHKSTGLAVSKRVLVHVVRQSRGPLLILWTAPTTGIAMCLIPTAREERREFAVGYFRK